MRSIVWRCAAALMAVCALAGASAPAQALGEKPITLVVPWPPGGATDALSRTLAQRLSERLKQTVLVDNRPGAGGNIGTASFVQAAPDGNTLIMATSSTNAANPHLYGKLAFDPVEDFAPVAFVASIPNLLEVPKDSPFATVADLVAHAKAHPGELNFASGGAGSSQHLAGATFTHLNGVDIEHVPYQGSGPAVTDLIAGHMDLMLDTGSIGQVKDGALRALAVAYDQRIPALPDVPTLAEAGLPAMKASAWYMIAAPRGTPEPVVDRLHQEFTAVLAEPAVRERLVGVGAILRDPQSPAELKAFLRSEVDRYRDIVAVSGATMN